MSTAHKYPPSKESLGSKSIPVDSTDLITTLLSKEFPSNTIKGGKNISKTERTERTKGTKETSKGTKRTEKTERTEIEINKPRIEKKTKVIVKKKERLKPTINVTEPEGFMDIKSVVVTPENIGTIVLPKFQTLVREPKEKVTVKKKSKSGIGEPKGSKRLKGIKPDKEKLEESKLPRKGYTVKELREYYKEAGLPSPIPNSKSELVEALQDKYYKKKRK